METRLNRLTKTDWKDLKDIILFGYGRYGSRVLPYLQKDFNIVAIVDNDVQKQGKIVDGISIVNLKEAQELLHNYKVIVAVQAFFYAEICKQLEEMGLREYDDFIIWSQFFPEWYYKYQKKICVEKTDIVITSFCSLNCESCSAFIPYIKEKKHEKLKDLENSIRLFFERVDRVQDMNLYGGEPFLHPQLCGIIELLGKYRDKIGYLGIITNGTIIPDSQVLHRLKKYHIGVSISDYSASIDYKGKLDRLCKILNENEISTVRTVNMIWFDLGFPRKKMRYGREEAKTHMTSCNTACHDLIDGKIYYCIADRAAQLGGLIPYSKKSYVDLNTIDKDSLESRKEILELCAGNIEGGYLDFCQLCGGFGYDNKDEILAAKQINKNVKNNEDL